MSEAASHTSLNSRQSTQAATAVPGKAAVMVAEDNRAEASVQRQYQEMADSSPQSRQAAQLQALANRSAAGTASSHPAVAAPVQGVIQLAKDNHAAGDLYYGISAPRYDMAGMMGAAINVPAGDPVSVDNMNAESGVTDTFKNGDDYFKGYFTLVSQLESNSFPVQASWPPIVSAWVQFLKNRVDYLKVEKHYNKLKTRTGTESRSKDVLTKNGQPTATGKNLDDVRQAIIAGYDNKTSEINQISTGTNYKTEVNGWLWDVFFRRTSKLGIDFTVERKNTIHMNMHAPGRHGAPDSKVDQEAVNSVSGGAGRVPITFSEMRHIYRKYGHDHAHIHLADYKSGDPSVSPAANPAVYEQLYMIRKISGGPAGYLHLIQNGSADRFKKYYGLAKLGGEKPWPETLSSIFNEDADVFRQVVQVPAIASGLRTDGYFYLRHTDTVDYFMGTRLRLVANLNEAGAPNWAYVNFDIREYYYNYNDNKLYNLVNMLEPNSKKVRFLHGAYYIHDLITKQLFCTFPMKTPAEATAAWAKSSDGTFYVFKGAPTAYDTDGFNDITADFTQTPAGMVYNRKTGKAYHRDSLVENPLPLSDKLALQIKPADEDLRDGWRTLPAELRTQYADWVRVNCQLVIRALEQGRIEKRR